MPGDAQGDKSTTPLKCPECGVKFESHEDLEAHLQMDHPEVGAEGTAAGKKSEALPAPKVRHAHGRRSLRRTHIKTVCCGL